jgi:hypothetical protein
VLFTEIGHLVQVIFFCIFLQFQELLEIVFSESRIEETVERFNLDVAMKSFMSPILDKRLRGVKYIKKMISRTEIKGNAMGMPISKI